MQHIYFLGMYQGEAVERSKERIQVSQWDWHCDSNEKGFSHGGTRKSAVETSWKPPPIVHMVIQHKHYGKLQHIALLYSFRINTVQLLAGQF